MIQPLSRGILKVPANKSCRSLDKAYAGADREHFQYYLIDGFIVSSDIEVKSCKGLSLDFAATDHNPVLLTAVLK